MNLVTMILACSLYPNNSITNAMVQVGSNNNPYTISTIITDGQTNTKTFKTAATAVSYASAEIAKGQNINVGLLQIPESWLAKYPASMDASLSGVMRPCKNMFIATDILNQATEQCAGQTGDDKTACALSIYHSGSPTAGLDYAKQVMAYAAEKPFIKPPSVLEQVSDSSNPEPITNANNNGTTDNNGENTASTDNSNSLNANNNQGSVQANTANTLSPKSGSGAPVTDLSNGDSVGYSDPATSTLTSAPADDESSSDPSTQNANTSSQDPAAAAAPFMPADGNNN